MRLVQSVGPLEPQFREIVNNALDRRSFMDVTTAGADTEFEVEHGFGFIPVGYLVIGQDKAATVYKSTTAWNNEKIYLKASAGTVALRIMVF